VYVEDKRRQATTTRGRRPQTSEREVHLYEKIKIKSNTIHPPIKKKKKKRKRKRKA
jgi:hypothetical protein